MYGSANNDSASLGGHLRRPKCSLQTKPVDIDEKQQTSPFGYPFTLNNWNRNYNINIPGKVVILFYRDGCPHCETMKPAYAEAAKVAQTMGATFGFVNTGEPEQEQLMNFISKDQSPYDVNGVPTIVSYYNGRFFSKFGGQRTMENLLKWAAGIGTADVSFVKQ